MLIDKLCKKKKKVEGYKNKFAIEVGRNKNIKVLCSPVGECCCYYNLEVLLRENLW